MEARESFDILDNFELFLRFGVWSYDLFYVLVLKYGWSRACYAVILY